MELLSVNVSGKTRKTTLNGREYVVAPLTMIVPGVLAGSKGALYYPPEEVARDPSSWNGMPLTLGHPVENGAHVSGRSPGVWDKSLLGHVFNAAVDDKGRLKAEGYFDVETVRRADAGILASLSSGKPVELSTGLFTENEPAPEGATHNGRPYQFIAKNYRADHLAILVGQAGACSVADGCGVLVNEQPDLIDLAEQGADVIDNVSLKGIAGSVKGFFARCKRNAKGQCTAGGGGKKQSAAEYQKQFAESTQKMRQAGKAGAAMQDKAGKKMFKEGLKKAKYRLDTSYKRVG